MDRALSDIACYWQDINVKVTEEGIHTWRKRFYLESIFCDNFQVKFAFYMVLRVDNNIFVSFSSDVTFALCEMTQNET